MNTNFRPWHSVEPAVSTFMCEGQGKQATTNVLVSVGYWPSFKYITLAQWEQYFATDYSRCHSVVLQNSNTLKFKYARHSIWVLFNSFQLWSISKKIMYLGSLLWPWSLEATKDASLGNAGNHLRRLPEDRNPLFPLCEIFKTRILSLSRTVQAQNKYIFRRVWNQREKRFMA